MPAPPGAPLGVGSPFLAQGQDYRNRGPMISPVQQPTGNLAQQQQQQRLPPRPNVPPVGPGGPGGPPGGGGQVQPPTGIYDVYEQGRQRMLEDAQRGIEGAMGTAGFSGNRYGTSAMNMAAEQFRRANQPFQEQFTNMLYQQGQSDLNRQLEATAMGLEHQLGLQGLSLQNMLGQGRLGLDTARFYDEAMQNRINQMYGIGAGETSRFDQLANQAMADYQANQFGYLPMIGSLLSGTTPQQRPPGQTTTAGSPGFIDYVGAFAPIIAAFASDRRMKKNIKPTGKKIGPFKEYAYKFKGTNRRGRGPMAQDVEKKWPDAVHTMPGSGYKLLNLPRLSWRLAQLEGAI